MKKTNMNKANETHVNGNSKGVRDITNNIYYPSMTLAAMAKNVRLSSLSYAVKHETPCKGSHFILESELYKNGDKLCEENAKANARAEKANVRANQAEAREKALLDEMAEFHQWKAEQEAKRKAEEKARKEEEARLERERKEEEKRQKLIAQKKEKIAQFEAEVERRKAKLNYMEQKLMCAEIELEALMDNGKEVV